MTSPSQLRGLRVDYPLARTRELCGPIVVELDVLADLDAAVDALCAAADPDEALRLAPYFGTVWTAGRALARWLAERPALVRGRRVAEVGCGLGLPALVAARLGAHVLACDAHPDVEGLMRRNAALSGVVIAYRRVDLTDLDALLAALGPCDLVLASDVIYDASIAGHVAAALAALTRPTGQILLADPGRPLLQRVADDLCARGFVYEFEPLRARRGGDRPGPAHEEQDVYLLRFSRAP